MSHIIARRAFVGSALATAALVATKGASAASEIAPTPDQPMGPFYPVARPTDSDADLTWIKGHKQRATGKVIQVTGRVLDRHGNPISGARLELWQCNSLGRYAHPADPATAALDPHFQGYASIQTDRNGAWRLTTIKPASYDSPIGLRTPHIHFDVRGDTHRLITQMYFPEDDATNSKDELFRQMGGDAGRTVAKAGTPGQYSWDVVLMDA